MYNNTFAPITVKTKVLHSCVSSSLLYSCETWGSASLAKIEILYRKAIKTTFAVRQNTPNNIIYTEFGLSPLKPTILKRQYKFWEKNSS